MIKIISKKEWVALNKRIELLEKQLKLLEDYNKEVNEELKKSIMIFSEDEAEDEEEKENKESTLNKKRAENYYEEVRKQFEYD